MCVCFKAVFEVTMLHTILPDSLASPLLLCSTCILVSHATTPSPFRTYSIWTAGPRCYAAFQLIAAPFSFLRVSLLARTYTYRYRPSVGGRTSVLRPPSKRKGKKDLLGHRLPNLPRQHGTTVRRPPSRLRVGWEGGRGGLSQQHLYTMFR